MSHLSRIVFVGKLNFRTVEPDLRFHFEQCGKVTDVEIVRDDSGQSKGFGFVKFERPQDASFAVERLEGSTLDGKQIHVEFNKLRLRDRLITKQIERDIRKKYQAKNALPEPESNYSNDEEDYIPKTASAHQSRPRYSQIQEENLQAPESKKKGKTSPPSPSSSFKKER